MEICGDQPERIKPSVIYHSKEEKKGFLTVPNIDIYALIIKKKQSRKLCPRTFQTHGKININNGISKKTVKIVVKNYRTQHGIEPVKS